jgi:hypothetical protein
MVAARIIFSLEILLAVFQTHGQIGAKVQQQGKITGLWQNREFGYNMTLILNDDGSGEFDGEPIKFKEQGSSLAITAGGKTTDYHFVLNANTMTLSGGDLDQPIIFTRQPPGEQSNAVTGTQPADEAFSATDKKLFGLWSGNGEMIEFKADGNCVYLGNTFPYKVSQGHIILTTAQGNLMLAYAISGTQLTLTVNGQKVIYVRVVGSGISSPTPTQPANGANVPMELVGQWCYMNMSSNSQTSRCIVLNADGTYVYSYSSSRSVNTETLSGGTSSQDGDRGTWYVQGDRIYYNSTASGQGSYRLEKRNHPKNVNDPMIVLDGEPFVTTTARAPWR